MNSFLPLHTTADFLNEKYDLSSLLVTGYCRFYTRFKDICLYVVMINGKWRGFERQMYQLHFFLVTVDELHSISVTVTILCHSLSIPNASALVAYTKLVSAKCHYYATANHTNTLKGKKSDDCSSNLGWFLCTNKPNDILLSSASQPLSDSSPVACGSFCGLLHEKSLSRISKRATV